MNETADPPALPPPRDRRLRLAVRLAGLIKTGSLTLVMPDGSTHDVAGPTARPRRSVVKHPRAVRRLVSSGSRRLARGLYRGVVGQPRPARGDGAGRRQRGGVGADAERAAGAALAVAAACTACGQARLWARRNSPRNILRFWQRLLRGVAGCHDDRFGRDVRGQRRQPGGRTIAQAPSSLPVTAPGSRHPRARPRLRLGLEPHRGGGARLRLQRGRHHRLAGATGLRAAAHPGGRPRAPRGTAPAGLPRGGRAVRSGRRDRDDRGGGRGDRRSCSRRCTTGSARAGSRRCR